MEDLNLDKPDKKFLTKKHIILIAIAVVLIIIAILLFFLLMKQQKVNEELKAFDVTYESESGNITLKISNKYDFSTTEKDNYDLVLKSSNSTSSIYFSEVPATTIRDKNKFIEYDKNDYISKFSNISEVSDVSVIDLNGYETYNYNFKYRDTMYVDVYWILKDSTFYVVDFNIDTTSNDFKDQIEKVLSTLVLN